MDAGCIQDCPYHRHWEIFLIKSRVAVKALGIWVDSCLWISNWRSTCCRSVEALEEEPWNLSRESHIGDHGLNPLLFLSWSQLKESRVDEMLVTSSTIILLQWLQATAWNCLFCVSLPSWNMKFWYGHDRNLIEWEWPIWGLQMLILNLCKSTTGNVATWSPWIKRFPCSPSTFHFKFQNS